jgi:hypothetical protein
MGREVRRILSNLHHDIGLVYAVGACEIAGDEGTQSGLEGLASSLTTTRFELF